MCGAHVTTLWHSGHMVIWSPAPALHLSPVNLSPDTTVSYHRYHHTNHQNTKMSLIMFKKISLNPACTDEPGDFCLNGEPSLPCCVAPNQDTSGGDGVADPMLETAETAS